MNLRRSTWLASIHTLRRSPALIEEVVNNLWAYRRRFVFTCLGITVAVSMVLGMRGVMQGLEDLIDEQFVHLGASRLYVTRVPWQRDLPEGKYLVRPRITVEVYNGIRNLPLVEEAVPYYSTRANVEKEAKSLQQIAVLGTWPSYLEVEGYVMKWGRFLVANDCRLGSRVAVVGADVAQKLNISNQSTNLVLRNTAFRVVGVLERKGSLLGNSLDQSIYIPLDTFESVLGGDLSLEIAVRLAPGYDPEQSMDELRHQLRLVRRLSSAVPDDFAVNGSARLLSQYRSIRRVGNSLIYGIGLLVLLVTGLGISNVTLATVRERAYEIGIKKAIGATATDIFFESLMEVVLMCLAGAAIGIVLGGGFGIFFRILSPLPVKFNSQDLFYSILFPVLTALFFGSIPAFMATQIQPDKLIRI
jgi:putative ABC transport system permease protein